MAKRPLANGTLDTSKGVDPTQLKFYSSSAIGPDAYAELHFNPQTGLLELNNIPFKGGVVVRGPNGEAVPGYTSLMATENGVFDSMNSGSGAPVFKTQRGTIIARDQEMYATRKGARVPVEWTTIDGKDVVAWLDRSSGARTPVPDGTKVSMDHNGQPVTFTVQNGGLQNAAVGSETSIGLRHGIVPINTPNIVNNVYNRITGKTMRMNGGDINRILKQQRILTEQNRNYQLQLNEARQQLSTLQQGTPEWKAKANQMGEWQTQIDNNIKKINELEEEGQYLRSNPNAHYDPTGGRKGDGSELNTNSYAPGGGAPGGGAPGGDNPKPAEQTRLDVTDVLGPLDVNPVQTETERLSRLADKVNNARVWGSTMSDTAFGRGGGNNSGWQKMPEIETEDMRMRGIDRDLMKYSNQQEREMQAKRRFMEYVSKEWERYTKIQMPENIAERLHQLFLRTDLKRSEKQAMAYAYLGQLGGNARVGGALEEVTSNIADVVSGGIGKVASMFGFDNIGPMGR
jgi:hypothetical protein